jgi:hypothetical protein
MNFTLDWQAERVGNAVMDVCENAVYDGAETVLKKAAARCPVETVESVERRSGSEKVKKYGAGSGALKASGRITKFKKQGVVGAYVTFGGMVVNGVDTYYGPFVELGTPGTKFHNGRGYYGHKLEHRVAVKARPFLRPALKSSRSKIRNAFQEILR